MMSTYCRLYYYFLVIITVILITITFKDRLKTNHYLVCPLLNAAVKCYPCVLHALSFEYLITKPEPLLFVWLQFKSPASSREYTEQGMWKSGFLIFFFDILWNTSIHVSLTLGALGVNHEVDKLQYNSDVFVFHLTAFHDGDVFQNLAVGHQLTSIQSSVGLVFSSPHSCIYFCTTTVRAYKLHWIGRFLRKGQQTN